MKRADVLTVVGLVALFIAVAMTSPRWSRLLRQPTRAAEEEAPIQTSAPPVPRPVDSASVVRTINVKLFFEDTQARGLVTEERSVSYQANLSRQLKVVVEELLRGSQSGKISPWVGGSARVLDVFVTARGTAYVDLSKEVTTTQVPGSRAELFAVYSLVDSIAFNFPAIKRVQILIDGQSALTLAGHVDLSRPLPPDMTLAAAPEATPGGQS
jgi:hypothetical protein